MLWRDKMEAISPRRKQILEFISDFIARRGYAPSVRDIAEACHISSSSVTQYHLNVLQKRGYIQRDQEVSRSITLLREGLTTHSIPLLGTIAAGEPIPVPSADTWASPPEEVLELPPSFTGHREGLFALRVKGTSMIDALIDDGDIVLMLAASTAGDGEMVAVWLKDKQEVTLKKLYREPGRIRLQPANTLMQPIYCEPKDIEIQGKVIAVLRKLAE